MSKSLLPTRRLLPGTLAVLLAVFALQPASAQTFTNPAPISIPDSGPATPYPSNIAVAGLAGNIISLTVTLFGLSHTFPDDIDILLVGPTGVKLLLMSDVGGFDDANGITLTFMDGAPGLPDSGQLVSGTFAPTNFGTGDTFPAPAPGGPYASLLSAFNGTNGNGLWSLYVVDDLGGDVGSISGGYSLNFTVVPEPSTYALLAGGLLVLAFAWKRRSVRA